MLYICYNTDLEIMQNTNVKNVLFCNNFALNGSISEKLLFIYRF